VAACTMFLNYLLHSATMILICKYRYGVLIRRHEYILWGKALFAIMGIFVLSVLPSTYWWRIAGFILLGVISVYCLRRLLSSMHLSLAQLLRRVLHVGK